ncbi:GNAT family N-acetyltransferase [Methanobrevibacter sp.]|uniref:GNAT family N-acetyltransferase n=1 Tax=Methanobrevibacter sp. TaxID=66852 RepID=UPI00388EAA4B
MTIVFTDEKDNRFLKLVEELDRGYYERIGDDLDKYKQYNEFKDPHIVILFLDSDKAVACASYRQCGQKSVEFKRVYVKKNYRKKGIAYTLIKQLEKKVLDENYGYSYIVTGKNNTPAIRLYEKLDYKQIPKFGQFKFDENVICMKKSFK